MSKISLSLLLVCILAASAHAQEEDTYSWRVHPKDALALGGDEGLSGFQSLIDARSPQAATDHEDYALVFSFPYRLGFGFHAQRIEHDFRGSQRVDLRRDRFGPTFKFGVTLLPEKVPIEIGVGVRGFDEERTRVSQRVGQLGQATSTGSKGREDGFGDLTLALKIEIPTGADAIALAPYAIGRLPNGDPDVELPARIEYGLAMTLAPGLGEIFAFHVDVAGVHEEHGVSAFRYRAGISVSFVPPGRWFLARIHAYGEGLEYEGRPTSDVDLRFGAQLIIARWVTLEAGFTHRFVHSGYRDDALRDFVRTPGVGVNGPILERHEEIRSQAFHVALGFLF